MLPALPTERLDPPRPRTAKFSLHSRLAQVFLPHQRLACRKQQQAVSLAAPTRPLGHGLRNNAQTQRPQSEAASSRRRTLICPRRRRSVRVGGFPPFRASSVRSLISSSTVVSASCDLPVRVAQRHHTTAPAAPSASEGLSLRALRALRNNARPSTSSFSLSPLPTDGPPPRTHK